jgi:Ca2+-binding EF-hand superfamily protein
MVMREFYPDKKRDFEKEFITPATKLFPEFSRSDLIVFIEAFREFDLDGSGSIDVIELGNLFKSMGQGSSRERLQEIIDEVDESGMGEINWIGFLKIMRMVYPDKRDEYEDKFYSPARNFPEFSRDEIDVFVETFRECDLDGSGSIDANELAELFTKMGQGCSRDKLQMIINAVDDDGNGVVSFDEFLKIMKLFYPDRKPSSAPPPSSKPLKTPYQPPPKNQPQQQQPVPTKPSQAKSLTASQEQDTGGSSNLPPGTKKCASCGKTVYPVEKVDALNAFWHKGCFKCQAEGCGITLNLKTFKGHLGKIYCSKHVPSPKMSQQTVV